MREVKRWDDEKYCRAYLIKSDEYKRREFRREYIEYLENWNEEYYYDETESYIHLHIECFDVF